MNTTISERDKTLITILLVIVILVGYVNYLILPMMNRSDELDVEIQEAEMQKQEMSMKISQLPIEEERLTQAQEDFKKVSGKYYAPMTSQEIEKEITHIVLDCGLVSKDLTITMPTEASQLEPYYASELAMHPESYRIPVEVEEDTDEKHRASGLLKGMQEDAGAEVEEDTQVITVLPNTEVYAAAIQVVAEGTEEQYQELIDIFNEDYPAIRVTGYQYSEKTGESYYDEDGNLLTSEEGKILTISMEFYICDDTLEVNYDDIQNAVSQEENTEETTAEDDSIEE